MFVAKPCSEDLSFQEKCKSKNTNLLNHSQISLRFWQKLNTLAAYLPEKTKLHYCKRNNFTEAIKTNPHGDANHLNSSKAVRISPRGDFR